MGESDAVPQARLLDPPAVTVRWRRRLNGCRRGAVLSAGFPANAEDWVFPHLSPAEQARVSMVLTPRVGAPRPTFDTAVEGVLDA